ncbi:MAG: portal protein, partial [Nitrosospira sp.]
MFERCDPFEVYPDPLATDKSNMRYLIHALPRTIGELKNNSKYKNREQISPDQKIAASSLKESQIRQNIAGAMSFSPSESKDLETTLVLETFVREWSSYSNKWLIQLLTVTETGVLLREQTWHPDEYPFECYQADVSASILDTKGVIHNIREPNRALNQIVSQTHESARVMGKLNWIMPRGSNVNVITDETGQFIEYDVTPGGRPEQAQPAGLPNYIPNHMAYLERSIQDIGGAGDAMLGKTPFAQASGSLVETLREGDTSNLSMMRDNLDDFLVRSFKLMLKTAKVNGKSKRKFRAVENDEFGQYRWIEIDPKEISTEDDLQVRSGTNTPYSIEQKQQMYLSLWKEGVIRDPNAILKLMELSDVANTLGDDELDIERQLGEIKAV